MTVLQCTAALPNLGHQRCARKATRGSVCGLHASRGCTVPSYGWAADGTPRPPFHYQPAYPPLMAVE